MAEQHGTSQASAAERELRIEIVQDQWAQFEGTAAQLQAEGLIPDGLKWPRANSDEYWEANGFKYWLRRTRPEGHKGPPSSWWVLDNWFIRVTVVGRDYAWGRWQQLQRRAEQVRADYRRYTDEGAREWNEGWERRNRAANDEAFQAFKARVPGLIPPKRGRKAKG